MNRGDFLKKKLSCLAGEAKLAMAATNLAPSFDFENFLVRKSTHILISNVNKYLKTEVFYIISSKLPRFLNQ